MRTMSDVDGPMTRRLVGGVGVAAGVADKAINDRERQLVVCYSVTVCATNHSASTSCDIYSCSTLRHRYRLPDTAFVP